MTIRDERNQLRIWTEAIGWPQNADTRSAGILIQRQTKSKYYQHNEACHVMAMIASLSDALEKYRPGPASEAHMYHANKYGWKRRHTTELSKWHAPTATQIMHQIDESNLLL